MYYSPQTASFPCCFNAIPPSGPTKKRYLDFYQREYKWKGEHVSALLDDVFHRFDADYDQSLDATQENVDRLYQWYYLSSFITNDYKGRIYIVGGQQRLTTLTLILIKLIHLARKFGQFQEVLQRKVYGPSLSGNNFWMGQNGRQKVLEDLLDDPLCGVTGSSISERNMYSNYEEISTYLDNKLATEDRFRCFVTYLLKKIFLVKIHIPQSTDVPTVFEVINDRGERLRPYEVFKGELLGQLDKEETEQTYLALWNQSIEPLENKGAEEPDMFFRYYFRAKYVNTEAEHRQFDGDYHKTVFSKDWGDQIRLRNNPHRVKEFIKHTLTNYGRLYAKLIDEDIYNKPYGEHVYYNYLNQQDRQYMLILSACEEDDPDEEKNQTGFPSS